MDARLSNTALTGDYVAKHMKNLDPEAVIKSVEAERIAIDHGRSSHILRLKLTWQSESHGLPKSVVIKTPTVETIGKFLDDMLGSNDEKERLKAKYAKGLLTAHNTECVFYELMGKNPPIAIPKCFVAVPVTEDGPGMIIMEDLSDRASIPPSVAYGLTHQQTLSALTQVARLQAWCLTTEVDWRSKVHAVHEREELHRGWYASVPSGLQNTKEKLSKDYGTLDVQKLTEFCSYEAVERNMKDSRNFLDEVIVIMDFHMNNILYEKKSDGTVNDNLVAIVDFQGMVRGCPIKDVANLLCISVNHKTRRSHEKEFLHHYYTEIKKLAGEKFKASFEEIYVLYKKWFLFSAIHFLTWGPVMGPVVLIKSEGEEKKKETEELLETIRATYNDAAKNF